MPRKTAKPEVSEEVVTPLPKGIYLTQRDGSPVLCDESGKAIQGILAVYPQYKAGHPPNVTLTLTPVGFMKTDGTAEIY